MDPAPCIPVTQMVPESPVLGHGEVRTGPAVLRKLLLQQQGSSNPTSSGEQGKWAV